MKTLDYRTYEKVYVIGDIHGYFGELYNVISNDLSDSIIIIAGDIGLGFRHISKYRSIFFKINAKLKEINSYILMLRGNHDDPSYFNGKKVQYSNFKTIKDYTVVQTKNHNILCVGGGLSIDRCARLVNISYWNDEEVKYDEKKLDEIHKNNIVIDSVITHTYPRVPNIKTSDKILQSWMEIDSTLKLSLDKEDESMIKLQEKLETFNHIKIWVCGHLHIPHSFVYNGTIYQQTDCNFTIYDMDNLIEDIEKEEN